MGVLSKIQKVWVGVHVNTAVQIFWALCLIWPAGASIIVYICACFQVCTCAYTIPDFCSSACVRVCISRPQCDPRCSARRWRSGPEAKSTGAVVSVFHMECELGYVCVNVYVAVSCSCKWYDSIKGIQYTLYCMILSDIICIIWAFMCVLVTIFFTQCSLLLGDVKCM